MPLSSEIIDTDVDPTLIEVDEICDTSVESIRNVLYQDPSPGKCHFSIDRGRT